jgi:hypothetical protein
MRHRVAQCCRVLAADFPLGLLFILVLQLSIFPGQVRKVHITGARSKRTLKAPMNARDARIGGLNSLASEGVKKLLDPGDGATANQPVTLLIVG